ncbi:hypothetical protein [Actinoplanes sp. NPDC051851]|uniref:hypothetical protein n=1 Tax=Actinoplanes sp. NPDC051851 TaxID=3154753 RepID=UPI0034285E43
MIQVDEPAIGYSRGVGPGVWDIHSPRVPSRDEVVDALRRAIAAVPAQRLWVNPDCGLKTHGYAEAEASSWSSLSWSSLPWSTA